MVEKKPFYARIREAREQKGISARRACKYGNVSERVWLAFEQGLEVPDKLTLKKVFGSHHGILLDVPDAPERPGPSPRPDPLPGADASVDQPRAEADEGVADVRSSFREVLRAEIRRAGLARKDLGEIVGVTASAVDYWLGTGSPDRKNIEKLVLLFPPLAAHVFEAREHKEDPGRRRAADKERSVSALMTRMVETLTLLRGREAEVVLTARSVGFTLLVACGDRDGETSGPDGEALVRAVLDDVVAEAKAELSKAREHAARLESLAGGSR